MPFPRCSGILLHPTSFPGRFGIGDLGIEAYQFVDFLSRSRSTTLADITPWPYWLWKFALHEFFHHGRQPSAH